MPFYWHGNWFENLPIGSLPKRAEPRRVFILTSPTQGDTAFTAPLFDEFMKRIIPRA
jgi:hypothetical protein